MGEKQCTKRICKYRFYGTKKPPEIQQVIESCEDAKASYIMELKQKLRLRKLCWETMFGQELVKLTVFDTFFTIGSVFVGDFFRSLFLRIMNPCWFWDLESNFPKYPDFKVAENILHLVNNQGKYLTPFIYCLFSLVQEQNMLMLYTKDLNFPLFLFLSKVPYSTHMYVYSLFR